MRNLIHSARIDRHPSFFGVGLSANTVKLVFDKKLIRHCPSDVCEICGRGREHELNRMKQSHTDGLQIVCPGTNRGFSNVAEQHVYPGHLRQGPFKSASYCV